HRDLRSCPTRRSSELNLSSNHDRQSTAGGGVVDVQRTDTVVSARLGEWVTIGGVGDLESGQRRDVGRRITTRNTAQQSIRLMVENRKSTRLNSSHVKS